MIFILRSHDTPTIEPDERKRLLGGKASTLAVLNNAGFPVPAWVVLIPRAFYASLTGAQWQALEHARSSTEVQAVLRHLTISPQVSAELGQALADLCPDGARVAVRSSAVEEDDAQTSYAGQFESYLNVAPRDVAAQVLNVWRSAFSERVLAYRAAAEQGQSGQELVTSGYKMPVPAVIIQRMVQADASGVAFSANPVSGQRGVAVVAAVRGLGLALVSGEHDSDTYHIGQHGQIISRKYAEQQPVCRASAVGEEAASPGIVVPSTDASIAGTALTDEQARAVAALARQAEHTFHSPQDIEWALEGDQLFLLQSRPITTLTRLPDPDGALAIWDNSNIAESYSGVTTPLTFSFARRAYEEVYRQFCRIMGVPQATIAENSTTFRRMIGLVQGRIYYNLLNWYRLVALLPGYTFNRGFMEQMMGVKQALPDDMADSVGQTGRGKRLRDGLALLGSIKGLLSAYRSLPRRVDQFYQRLDAALGGDAPDLRSMRPDELAAYYRRLERDLLPHWDAPIINDFFAMIFYGVLRKLCASWCGDSTGSLQNDLLCGEGGMISAEPAAWVRTMAQVAAPYPDMVRALCEEPLSVILRQIEQRPAFDRLYRAYLAKFGERCMEELKLESATLHDDPLVLLRSAGHLASRLGDGRVPADAVTKTAGYVATAEADLRQSAEKRVQAALRRRPLRRRVFGWVLNSARARVRDRENLRFERTRVFGRARKIFVELGHRFHALDLLDDPRDIFYLEADEILGFVEGTATCTDLRGLTALRKAEFARYRAGEPPADRFETRGMVYQGHAFQAPTDAPLDESPAPTSTECRGTGCCPGVVRGQVRVVRDPRHATLRPGDILVAERTDPGWVMLFPSAAGLLVERGSLLSHSAIVAREMGIPAVVSIGGVTHWLNDGDLVELDGSSGMVRLLQRAGQPPAEGDEEARTITMPTMIQSH